MSGTTPPSNPPMEQPMGMKELTEKDLSRRRLGLGIAIVGAVILIPSIAISMAFAEVRGLAALVALGGWFVWKIGRGIQRVHSGLQ